MSEIAGIIGLVFIFALCVIIMCVNQLLDEREREEWYRAAEKQPHGEWDELYEDADYDEVRNGQKGEK